MEIYVLVNPEEIKDPCDTCSSFDKNEGCISSRGECWSKTRYYGQQAILSHAKKIDIDREFSIFAGASAEFRSNYGSFSQYLSEKLKVDMKGKLTAMEKQRIKDTEVEDGYMRLDD